jgi:hypothetical protein
MNQSFDAIARRLNVAKTAEEFTALLLDGVDANLAVVQAKLAAKGSDVTPIENMRADIKSYRPLIVDIAKPLPPVTPVKSTK